MTREKGIMVLLGAEELADVEREPWIREAVEEERACFIADNDLDEWCFRALLIDRIRRP